MPTGYRSKSTTQLQGSTAATCRREPRALLYSLQLGTPHFLARFWSSYEVEEASARGWEEPFDRHTTTDRSSSRGPTGSNTLFGISAALTIKPLRLRMDVPAEFERLLEMRPKNMASLDWAQCPIVGSIPGKVSGAWVSRGTRTAAKVLFEDLQAGLSIDEVVERFPVIASQSRA